MRKHLLGIDNPERPLRSAPAHPEVFNATVQYCARDATDQQVTAALERAGIMIAVGDTAALYTAEDARDLAAYLEDAAEKYEWVREEIHDLIAFLKEGADRLESGSLSRNLHEEFHHWR